MEPAHRVQEQLQHAPVVEVTVDVLHDYQLKPTVVN